MLCPVTGLRKMGAADTSETCVPVCQTAQRHAPQDSILRKMGAADTSETCVPVCQTARRHAPQDSIFKELAVRMRDLCRHSDPCPVKDFSY